MISDLPIGVFDSGMGGLTVLSALLERLPREHMIYLGDTARLPYGTKSPRTVARYATQAAARLVDQGVKLLVVACNTATAAALDDLRAAFPALPILGVVEPGAQAACKATRTGSIAVIATESTIRNAAYQRAIQAIKPEARVFGQPCPLFVPLAEEGWVDGEIVEAVAKRYLAPLFPGVAGEPAPPASQGPPPDCLVLGCTHFPPLTGVLRRILGPAVQIVDSAATTAEAAAACLERLNLRNRSAQAGRARFMTTDDEARFARIGALFLGRPLSVAQVELVNL